MLVAAAKSHQLCLTLCNPIDGGPPGSSPWDFPGKSTGVGCHFLLQCMKVKSESEVAQSCLTLHNPIDCAHQASPSLGFPRQEYWSGLPLPSLPDGTSGKKHACQHKRLWCGLIPGLGRSPGERNDNPLQYSCLENFMEGGAWRATVHRVTKSPMWWKWLCMHRENQRVWTLWIWHDSTAKSTLEPVPSPGTWKTVN